MKRAIKKILKGTLIFFSIYSILVIGLAAIGVKLKHIEEYDDYDYFEDCDID